MIKKTFIFLALFSLVLFFNSGCSEQPSGSASNDRNVISVDDAFAKFKEISDISTQYEKAEYELSDCKFRHYLIHDNGRPRGASPQAIASSLDLRAVDVDSVRLESYSVYAEMKRGYTGKMYFPRVNRKDTLTQSLDNLKLAVSKADSGIGTSIIQEGRAVRVAVKIPTEYELDADDIKVAFAQLVKACQDQ